MTLRHVEAPEDLDTLQSAYNKLLSLGYAREADSPKDGSAS